MSFCLQFRASRYIMHLNRTSEWNVMTIWISRTPPLFIFERLDISLASHIQQSQKLRPFEFAESFRSQFRPSRYIMPVNEYPSEMLWPFQLLESFRCSFSSVLIYHGPFTYTRVKSCGPLNMLKASCSISCVLIYYAPESSIRVKSSDHLNFSIASMVNFRASQNIMDLSHIPESKVMAIWILWASVYNFERLDISCASNIHSSQKLWPIELAETVHVEFWEARYIMSLNRTSKWRVSTIWIFRELSQFIFKRLEVSWPSHIHRTQKLWLFEFFESYHVQFWESRYIMSLNRTS